MKHKSTWKLVIQVLISILTAIATTLGLNSGMA
ncbi:smalltalk protein [Hallella bergensis]|nr:smalltalk protein [Hallella bergensis]